MAKRRKPKSKLGSIVAILCVAVIAAGCWYYWKEGKTPALPRWGGFDSKKPVTRTNQPVAKAPARPATNIARPAPVRPPDSQTAPAPTNVVPVFDPPEHQPRSFRAVRDIVDAQIAFARKGISAGPIDGVSGYNLQRALLAWQIHNGLSVSGELDAESKQALLVEEPLYIQYTVSEGDLGRIMRVPSTWLGKSQVDRLDYESILELVAERGRASPTFIRKLNPGINWDAIPAGTLVKIPRIDPPPIRERASFIRVHIYSKTLDVFDKATNLIAHYPCSIAAKVEKRPIGTLHVSKVALNPSYLFDPEVFSESEEARKIGRKLNIPPGPNNPVGTAWIGLSKPGYGIHGTPKPEQVGRTESHGCFRLSNWNAEHLLQLVWVGCPVLVEP